MNKLWKDWIPGVLSCRQLRELCDEDFIIGARQEEDFFDYSSFDLTLSGDAYLLKHGAIKPQGSYAALISKEHTLIQKLELDEGSFLLEPKQTYVFRIEQKLNAELKESPIYGQATAKSSVGRLDILARLIVDGMDRYEGFSPRKILSGDMFLEVTPLTFRVRVRPRESLSQLRLFYGKIEHAIIRGDELFEAVLPGSEKDGCLTVDLSDTRAGKNSSDFGAAFQAYREKNDPICLWKTPQLPDPKKYWEIKSAEQLGQRKRFRIEKDEFFILRSKQKIALTAGVAVYCRATDETIGEMRIHYAGFVHPFFGRERPDGITGTPLIFEVRGHDVKVILSDGEKLAQLEFYRMSEDCKYDSKRSNDYGEQNLKLSKFFAEWE